MQHTLLIIEDNQSDCDLVQQMLAEAGFVFERIVTARTGESGVEEAKAVQPTIAIVDAHLPGINGFEACAKLKELMSSRIRVVMMTGLVDAIDAVRARKMGSDDFCVKTADMAQVVNAVKRLM